MHRLWTVFASRSRPSRHLVLTLLGIALFVFSVALYARALAYGFIGYDEYQVLIAHPNLYANDSLWTSLWHIFVGYFPREEPLLVRDVSWMIDAWIFGFTNPAGYHLGNVLLNAANVILLFGFLVHATRSVGLAAGAAALFAVLAVHVEPVCWVMGRKDLLSAFFVLLALTAQSAQLRHEDPRIRRWLALAIFLLYPLAVLSKFSAIVLVAVLAAQRMFAPYLDRRRSPSEPFTPKDWPRPLLGLLPHSLVGLALYVWYGWNLSAFQIIANQGPPALSFRHLQNLVVLIPQSIQASLMRILRSAGHSVYYLRPNVEVRSTVAEIALGFATVAGYVGLTLALVRFRKDLAFFALAFLLFLLPYFNIQYVGIWASDRYSYLASLGIVVLLVAPVVDGLRSRTPRIRQVAWGLGALLVMFGGWQVVGGWRHQSAFRDRESLWRYEKSRPQPSMLAYASYANLLIDRAAEAKPSSPERHRWLTRAVAVAKEGVRHYGTVPWKPAPGYVPRERLQLASLFSLLGSASELAGGTVEQQVEFYRAAVQVAPGGTRSRDLARALLSQAMRKPRTVEVARESLRHYRDYARWARRDALELPRIRDDLRIFAADFPELAAEVQAIQAESLP